LKQPAFSGLSVLIVDDSKSMRNLIRTLLRTFGIDDVMEAGDGAAALELIQSHRRDLIITDLSMTPMDGVEFVRRLRQPGPGGHSLIPVLMISGHTELVHVKSALDAGVTEFLAKPVTAAALLLRIGSILARPKSVITVADYSGPDRRRSPTSINQKRRRKGDKPTGRATYL
jgi:two-component system chemotaxis response regulator CheY